MASRSVFREVQFIVFPFGEKFSRSIQTGVTWSDVKELLFKNWSSDLPPLEAPSKLRLIRGGKELVDAETVPVEETAEALTVHIAIRKGPPPAISIPSAPIPIVPPVGRRPHSAGGSMPSSRGGVQSASAGSGSGSGGGFAHWTYSPNSAASSPASHPPSPFGGLASDTESEGLPDDDASAAGSADDDFAEFFGTNGSDVHFHGLMFDEDEAAQTKLIFHRKKGDDGLIGFQEAHAFLRSYWRFATQRGFHAPNSEFPMATLLELKQKLLGARDRLTLEEFRQVFFLLDNSAAEELCPHGEKRRVLQTVEKLHSAIRPESRFDAEVFETVFRTVKKESPEANLTCREIESLLYLYAVTITEQQQQQQQQ